jgi:hypothetical protein
MIAQKQTEVGRSTAGVVGAGERKPWKKKTPVEVVLDQIGKLRDQVVQQEEELKQAKKQLQKLEEARKVLETN